MPAIGYRKLGRVNLQAAGTGFGAAAAALQFLLAHPAVVSHVPGIRTVEQMNQNIAWAEHPIPSAFWQDLKRCARMHRRRRNTANGGEEILPPPPCGGGGVFCIRCLS